MKEPTFPDLARFERVQRIGAGGMGVVYEAYDREYQSPVALKLLRISGLGDQITRFKNEFRILQDLRHPNLVRYLDLLEHEGQWFFTMEYVDGVDFIQYVRPSSTSRLGAGSSHPVLGNASPFTPTLLLEDSLDAPAVEQSEQPVDLASTVDMERLRDGVLQLVSGLSELHHADNIHRDVKPENVLIDGKGRLVVLDFGLATRVGEAKEGEVLGTPTYMAPEQSSDAGPKSDWYSVGVMLFEALTGQPPFQGRSFDLVRLKRDRAAPRVSSFVPEIPEVWDELCASLLRADSADRPDAHDILRQLGQATKPLRNHRRRSQTNTALVGRQIELASLEHHFEVVSQGEAQTVFIHGESGVGKSLLMREFVRGLADDVLVLSGRCFERESVPYKAIDGVVDHLAEVLAAMPSEEVSALLPADAALLLQAFPVLKQVRSYCRAQSPDLSNVHPHQVRSRVFTAFRETLRALAVTTPVVVTIDDLQWTDQDSLGFLASVMSEDAAPPILLVACVQTPSESAQAVAQEERIRFSEKIQDIRLRQLCQVDAESLAVKLANTLGVSNANVAQIATEAAGHPLFIDVLLRHLGSREGRSKGITLEEAIQLHISELPVEIRSLLELVSVAGKPITRACAAQALDLPPTQLIDFANHLRSERLLRSEGARSSNTVEPYHSRVRAVARALSPEKLADYHARLANTLAAQNQVDPELVAVHFAGAGNLHEAIKYTELAAAQAIASHAHDRACRLYREAIDFRQSEGLPLLDSWKKLGGALINAGRGVEASAVLLSAAKAAESADAMSLQHQAAEQLLLCGHIDESATLLTPVLKAHGFFVPGTKATALAMLLAERALLRIRPGRLRFMPRSEAECQPQALHSLDALWSASIGFLVIDQIRGFAYQTRHLRMALETGEPTRVARGLCTEAVGMAIMGGPPKKVANLIRTAKQLSAGLDNDYVLAFLRGSEGAIAHFEGRWEDAYQFQTEAKAMFETRCTGVTWELESLNNLLRWSRAYLGRLDELASEVTNSVKAAQERGDHYAVIAACSGLPNIAWLIHDAPDVARKKTNSAVAAWTVKGFHMQHMFDLFAQVQIDIYTGKGTEAWARLRQAWPRLLVSGTLKSQFSQTVLRDLRARASLAAWRADSSRKHLNRARGDAKWLEQCPHDWTTDLARLIYAQLAQIEDSGRSVALYEQAAKGFEAKSMRLHACAAQSGASGAVVGSLMENEGVANPPQLLRVFAPLLSFSP